MLLQSLCNLTFLFYQIVYIHLYPSYFIVFCSWCRSRSMRTEPRCTHHLIKCNAIYSLEEQFVLLWFTPIYFYASFSWRSKRSCSELMRLCALRVCNFADDGLGYEREWEFNSTRQQIVLFHFAECHGDWLWLGKTCILFSSTSTFFCWMKWNFEWHQLLSIPNRTIRVIFYTIPCMQRTSD